MIYPIPVKTQKSSEKIILPQMIIIKSFGDNSALINKWCSLFEYDCSETGNIHIIANKVIDERMKFNEKSLTNTDEKYVINIYQKDNIIYFEIDFAFEKGLWHALCTIGKLLKSDIIDVCHIEDYPMFQKRGFIEGFYGKPWDDNGRYEIMKLMSYFHMNTYYYAPKDDLYHREHWESLYNTDDLNKLKNTINMANDLYLEFYYCIAPGLTIEYSNDNHIDMLFNKLRQIYDTGVKNFGLFLDDITDELQYDSDKIKFKDISQAHIYLVNTIFKKLKQLDNEIKLTVCPMIYHGKGNEQYITELGRGIDAEINIFWTGYNICSQNLTIDEAITFMNSTHHKPLYWDNFPVNDSEMFNEMHIGPICGRDEQLYRFSEGLISNCMEYVMCNKFSLITIADYLWNPIDYSPDASWKNSIETVLGKNSYERFVYLADNLRTSCLKDENSSIMYKTLYEIAFKLRAGEKERSVSILKEYIDNLKSVFTVLNNEQNATIANELKYWTDKYYICIDLLTACLNYLLSCTSDNKQSIIDLNNKYNFHPARLTDFCLQEFVDYLLKY